MDNTMTSLVEYLYIDYARLDAYFEQISNSPVMYDKVPTLKTGIGLTTLGVETTQTSKARPHTVDEKVKALDIFLNSNGLVEELSEYSDKNLIERSRRELSGEKTVFFYATRIATKVTIPSLLEKPDPQNNVNIWISLGDPNLYSLFLLEDQKKEDKPTIGFVGSSAFTYWGIMLRHLYEINDDYNNQFIENHLALLEKLARDEGPILDKKVQYEGKTFCHAEDLQDILKRLGATISAAHNIRTLFRLRVGNNNIVYGYPIFISDADDADGNVKRWHYPV